MTDAAYLIRLSVKPECVEPFRTHTLALVHEASRHDACAHVQLLQGAADPSQFVLLESWSDEAYYLSEEHQQADYRTSYFDATKSMLRDVRIELLRTVWDDGSTDMPAEVVAAAASTSPEPAPEATIEATPDSAADAGPHVA